MFAECVEAQQHFFTHVVQPIKEEFLSFCHLMCEKYKTFRFWNQYLVKDCLCYINLWLAIRTGNWDLRISALKSMAPLFQAFDRQNYSFLIPCHLSQFYIAYQNIFWAILKGEHLFLVLLGQNFLK